MRAPILLLALLLAAPAAGSDVPPGDDGQVALSVYPEQQIGLVFTHRKHIEIGVACELCHASAVTSERVEDRNIADHSTCGLCHRLELPEAVAAAMYPKSSCRDCHGDYGGSPDQVGPPPTWAPSPEAPPPPPTTLPPARLRFSHKQHVALGLECLDCHAGVDTADLATREHLPPMGLCLTCHDGLEAPDDCTVCHLPGDDGWLQVRTGGPLLQPRGRFRPDDHLSVDWAQGHEAAARADAASCESCHQPSECLACHDGALKPQQIHPGDYVWTHGLEARRHTMDCSSCHDQGQGCTDCHTRLGVTPEGFPAPGSAVGGQRRFHPEGWGGTFGQVGGPEQHGHQARRSLESCRACHDGSFCSSCHTVVNPHPRGWAESGAFVPGRARALCSECHAPGDPALTTAE